ncbi:hypothetical protein TRIUR3_27673 [Triticum urartu]|uniref:Uncharacterized protein n=1 Tax=Triticum urartu TaxID=4572 RepID=M7YJM3_TRIUA|nr:hypothetical protein TRIUR3_27673 [Triticum urartu]
MASTAAFEKECHAGGGRGRCAAGTEGWSVMPKADIVTSLLCALQNGWFTIIGASQDIVVIGEE